MSAMSALSYISGYGSESSSSENSDCEQKSSKPKLPRPDLSNISVLPSENHVDNPLDHEGRLRTFPHVRGNWTTFVYIKCVASDSLINLLNNLETVLSNNTHPWKRCEDFHVSLSRTVVLKYHQISTFTSSLRTTLHNIESLDLGFSSIKIYCNEEQTRTFIALEIDFFSNKYVHMITEKVDQVLEEFNLPKFYEDPSYHLSVLWLNGNKKEELKSIADDLNKIVTQELNKSPITVLVNHINCKIGNKQYQFTLK